LQLCNLQDLALSAVDKEISLADKKLASFRDMPSSMQHFSKIDQFKADVKSKVRERGEQLVAVRKRMRKERGLPEEKDLSFPEENVEDVEEEDDEEALQMSVEERQELERKFQWGWKKLPTGSLIGTLLQFDFTERSSKHAVHVQTECHRFLASCRNYLKARFPKDEVLTALMGMFEPAEWKEDPEARMQQLNQAADLVLGQFGSYVDGKRLKSLELASFHTRMELWVNTEKKSQSLNVSRGTQSTNPKPPSMNQLCTAFLQDQRAVEYDSFQSSPKFSCSQLLSKHGRPGTDCSAHHDSFRGL
jgi:hypothetical protein